MYQQDYIKLRDIKLQKLYARSEITRGNVLSCDLEGKPLTPMHFINSYNTLHRTCNFCARIVFIVFPQQKYMRVLQVSCLLEIYLQLKWHFSNKVQLLSGDIWKITQQTGTELGREMITDRKNTASRSNSSWKGFLKGSLVQLPAKQN